MAVVQQPDYALYRVITEYIPSEEYEASGCMAIRRGDMLEVERPVNLEDGTEEKPKGMLVIFKHLSCISCGISCGVEQVAITEQGCLGFNNNTKIYNARIVTH